MKQIIMNCTIMYATKNKDLPECDLFLKNFNEFLEQKIVIQHTNYFIQA